MKYKLLFFISLILTLNSCISTGEVNYLQNIEAGYKLEAYKEYQIHTGDRLNIGISSHDKTLAKKFNSLITSDGRNIVSFAVGLDGNISIPFFGDVLVLGLTIQDAELKIQELIQESLSDAFVKVELSNNNFYILSSNRKGAFVAYKENLTIYQALAISGQTTETMDISKVSILRKDLKGNTAVKTFDLRTQEVIQSEYYYIYPNDIVYFPTNKNSFFNVTSLTTFTSAVMVPLSFLIYVSTYKF